MSSHKTPASFSYKHFKNENINHVTLSRMWVTGRSIGRCGNACLACVGWGRGGCFSDIQNSQRWGRTTLAACCALGLDRRYHQLPVCVSLTHFYSLPYSMSSLSSRQINKLQLQGSVLRTYLMDIPATPRLETLHPTPQAGTLLCEVLAYLQ